MTFQFCKHCLTMHGPKCPLRHPSQMTEEPKPERIVGTPHYRFGDFVAIYQKPGYYWFFRKDQTEHTLRTAQAVGGLATFKRLRKP